MATHGHDNDEREWHLLATARVWVDPETGRFAVTLAASAPAIGGATVPGVGPQVTPGELIGVVPAGVGDFCIGCGCTRMDACESRCSWLATDDVFALGVCSECPSHLDRFNRGDRRFVAELALTPDPTATRSEG